MQEVPDGSHRRMDLINLARSEIGEIIKEGAFNPRALPALQIFAYNFFGQHTPPTAEDRSNFQRTCREVSEQEDDAKVNINQSNGLTIGVEVEWYITPKVNDLVGQLYSGKSKQESIQIVPTNDEDPSDPLWEAVLPWTYSPKTQKFMLDQLMTLGAFEAPANADLLSINSKIMHVSFGIPPDITDREKTIDKTAREQLTILSDALVLAFSSPNVIEQRKTDLLFTTGKEAETQTTPDQRLDQRLELTCLEFDEDTIELLLENARNLALGAFSWMRKNVLPPYLHLNHTIIDIADEFTRFSSEASAFRNANNLSPNILNNDKDILLQILSNSALVDRIRSIIQEASSRISDFTTPSDEWE